LKKRNKKVVMSSFIPPALRRWVVSSLEKRLSLRSLDRLNHFWLQTRLIFSKTAMAVVLGVLVFFTWITIAREISSEREAFEFLQVMVVLITVVLHMSLWESERDARTMELLLMRVSSPIRLIRMKMTISLFWTMFFVMLLLAGLAWFLDMHLLVFLKALLFLSTAAVFVAMFTCVVATFIHRSLPTGIVSGIIIFFLMGVFSEIHRLGWGMVINIFCIPFFRDDYGYTNWQIFKYWATNRILLIILLINLFVWLKNRLGRTQSWVA